MEGRDGDAILLDVDAVLERVRGADLADAVLGRHGAGAVAPRQVSGNLGGSGERRRGRGGWGGFSWRQF